MKQKLTKYPLTIMLIVLISIITGCEDRLWDNPRDKNSSLGRDEWAPQNLTAEQISVSSARLSWVQIENEIDGFIIDRKIGDFGWLSEYAKIKLDTTIVSGWIDTAFIPDPNLVHQYRLKAYAYDKTSIAVTKSLKPVFPPPGNLLINQLSDTVLKLNWTDNSLGEDGFMIDRKIDNGQWIVGFSQTAENESQWSDSNIVCGKTHFYRVCCYKADKKSQSIESQIVNTIPIPTNLVATVIDDQSLQLTWTDNCTYEGGFRIERDDGSGFTQIAEVDENMTTYTDAGLTYRQSYSYRVKAFTDINESDYSNEFDAEMKIPAPTNVTAAVISDQSLILTWTDNCTFESAFQLERKEEGGIYAVIVDLNANTIEYMDSGLSFGIDYYYRIRAFTENNESSYSNEVKASISIISDIDGNIYQAVKIGDQWWMAENLKVTHYRNGDAIPNVTDNSQWENLTTGAYCNYGNNSANVATYGRLYNWYAVDDSRNIAPEGWHVPTDEEWKELEIFLDMSQIEADDYGWRGTNEGSKLAGRADLWTDGDLVNNAAFGTSGFTALPGGCRGYYSGTFLDVGSGAYFWPSTDTWYRLLFYNFAYVFRDSDRGNYYGFSVRCVRD